MQLLELGGMHLCTENECRGQPCEAAGDEDAAHAADDGPGVVAGQLSPKEMQRGHKGNGNRYACGSCLPNTTW